MIMIAMVVLSAVIIYALIELKNYIDDNGF
jgi:hypothetical protein